MRVDGVDVREPGLADLRDAIGYVSQDVFLFDGTVRENITYGSFDATDEEVVAAAKAAETHEFVLDLPDDLDTRVGERGVKLSGGQHQRLSIARAMLQDPAILVLDEATSMVDTATELPSSGGSSASPRTGRPLPQTHSAMPTRPVVPLLQRPTANAAM